MKYIISVLLLCLVICQGSAQQGAMDTLSIRQMVDSGMHYRYVKPDLALKFGQQVVSDSRGEYYFGELNGLQIIGEAYYMLGHLDSALYFYRKALRRSELQSDLVENGNNSTGLATIFLDTGARDSSLHYYTKAIQLFEEIGDSSALCDAQLRLGNVHNAMGHHKRAIESYLKSIRICERIGRTAYIAYNSVSIGTVHDKQGDYLKAESYFLKGLEIFKSLNDTYGQGSVQNNLGILYKNMKAYDKSIEAYSQSLLLFEMIDFGRGKLSANTNLGILNVEMGNYENALNHSTIGLQIARDLQMPEPMADNLNWIARAQLGLGQYQEALTNAQEALSIANAVSSLEKQRDANKTLSEIYQALNAHDRSLEYYKAYTTIKDSLFNAEKSKQIRELQTIYETEKKDKEIQLLEKNAEIDRIRKTRLWAMLCLSFIAGGFLVYGQWSRRVRDKKIHAQESELEIQRRKTAELEKEKIHRELDFKKQELAAKALQLARKNEFLQSLNEEVDTMRAQSEGHLADSARKISRQIRMDIESEEEWELFLASFREVHRDFIEHLQEMYPDMTKSELRLSCLMKMNLSTKELAALLNITTDGVKKARYRLRKKMHLGSDVDIQDYLLRLPQ